jgi:hypothetical protein
MAWLHHGSALAAATKEPKMGKNLMALLIAAFAGLFQGVAEHIAKATVQDNHVHEMVPSLFGWPRDSACRAYPEGMTGFCAGGRRPALKTTPGQTNLQGACHRDPR